MSMNEFVIKDEILDISNKTNLTSGQNGNIFTSEGKFDDCCLDEMDYGYCDKCQTDLHLIKAHEATFHQNKEEIRCTFCGQLFLKRKKLVKHLVKIHESNNIKCFCCSKENFVEYEDLFDHLEEHMFLHIYFCHLCKDSFAIKSNFEDHLTTHLSSWKKPYLECPSCQMRFESQKAGVRKMKKHWVEEHSKNFDCIYCAKKFVTFTGFYSHCLRHTNQLPYVCNECGLGFRKRCRMLEHVDATHLNKFNYKCSECDLKFKYQTSFLAHLHIHDQSLRFSCNYCSKLFIRKVSLLDHFVEKLCSICNEEFHCKTTFDSHFKQQHELDKVFACDKCSKSYVLENALKRHKTVVHPKLSENFFKCSLCQYKTATRHNLNRHKRRNHQKK